MLPHITFQAVPAAAIAHLCDIVFLVALSISLYVCSNPSGWKIGSHPKMVSPLAGTIFPGVRPTNTSGSMPGPAECEGSLSAVSSFMLSMVFHKVRGATSRGHGPGDMDPAQPPLAVASAGEGGTSDGKDAAECLLPVWV